MEEQANVTLPLSPGDNSLDNFKFIIFIIDKYVWCLPVCLGIPGNVLTAIVMLRKNNRSSSASTYLVALSFADNVVLVNMASWTGYYIYTGVELKNMEEDTLEWFVRVRLYVGRSFSVVSSLLLAEMSVDRVIAVRRPLSVAIYCTRRKAMKCAGVTTACVCVASMHLFHTVKVSSANHNTGTVKVPEAPFVETIVRVLQLCFGSVIPFCIIVCCNVIIITTVRGSTGAKLTSQQSVGLEREKEAALMTRMLISVSAAYILTTVPLRIYDLTMELLEKLHIFDLKDPYSKIVYVMQLKILGVLWYFNFAINFYMYLLGGGRRYRAEVIALFKVKGK